MAEHDYCVKVLKASPYAIRDESINQELTLETIEETETESGKRCIIARIETRHVLICSDGQEFTVAYRIRC